MVQCVFQLKGGVYFVMTFFVTTVYVGVLSYTSGRMSCGTSKHHGMPFVGMLQTYATLRIK